MTAIRGVGADHNQLAVRKVDHIHQPADDDHAERGHQNQRGGIQAVEKQREKAVHEPVTSFRHGFGAIGFSDS